MGYTHYFEGAVEITEDVIADIKAIIKSSGVKIRGGSGTGKPKIVSTGIVLNGDADTDEDYETFLVSSDGAWSFCKTARYPYDRVVCAILIRLKETNPGFRVSSDGEWDDPDEWGAARELYRDALGCEAMNPLSE